MKEVLFNNNGGLGYILEKLDRESDFFIPKNFEVAGMILKPNDMTDLFGLFTSEVKFIGCHKNNDKEMIFYLGEEKNLFEEKRYYSRFFWIHSKRIVNGYSCRSIRDLNWVNGIWN